MAQHYYDPNRAEQYRRRRDRLHEKLDAERVLSREQRLDLQKTLRDLAVWRMTDEEFRQWESTATRTEAREKRQERNLQAHYAAKYGYAQLEAWRISKQRDASLDPEQYADYERDLEAHPNLQGVKPYLQKSCWSGPAPGDPGEMARLQKAGLILAPPPNHNRTQAQAKQPELIIEREDCPF